MLAIVSSDRCYVSNILDKVSYSKEKKLSLSEVYKCQYNNHEFIILCMGYGKVNIGSALRYICDKYNIKAILCIGTAGSINDSNDIFSAIIPNSCLQFDVDFMPNGYMPGQIPKINKSIYNTNNDINDCMQKACDKCNVSYSNDIIASSDMFVSNYNLANSIRREYDAGAVDCESGCVGEFAYINNISYSTIKVISNFGNNNGIKQYNLYDDESSRICQKITYKFLNLFYDE